MRIKKEVSFIFISGKRSLDANTVNYSRNGLGIKIYRKVALPIGDIVSFQAEASIAKAQVIWVKKEIDPFITLVGLKIVDGALNLKGARKNMDLTMTRSSL